jgi:hypothetical protein
MIIMKKNEFSIDVINLMLGLFYILLSLVI